jgi:hypothetical protein
LVYVTLFGSGLSGTVYRGVVNGASIAWTNITSNVPKWQDLSVTVVPHTGDVVVGGGVGPWAYPPPTGYAAEHGTTSRWSQMAVPVKPPGA